MDFRLNLDDIDFERLLEKGRSSIPGLAPEWTDHNVHDPGIMLIELLAFEAEAQIYALSRLRRDERIAYAKMLGITLQRPAPATALVWPFEVDTPLFDDVTLSAGAVVKPDYPDAPSFTTEHVQFLTGARLVRVATHFADGRIADQTRVNRRNGATFLPFGPAPKQGDSFVLGFAASLQVPNDKSAVLILGIETPEPARAEAEAQAGASLFRVSLRDDNGEQVLDIAHDTTKGMTQTGVIALDMPRRRQAGEGFEIVIRSKHRGLLRPPRLRRISPNVVPVLQRVSQHEEGPIVGTGLPDQVYLLREKGWVKEPQFHVRELEIGGMTEWTEVGDFDNSGPEDQVFTFDPEQGLIRFGNSVNGMAFPANGTLIVDYFTCAGAGGNLPANVRWSLERLGPYGITGEPCSGGRNADTLDELRAKAIEWRFRREPYVTSKDLAEAARTLPGLLVARAVELLPDKTEPRGTRVLLVVAERDLEDVATPESQAWIENIRSRLAPHVPLGQRLHVIAPRYVDIRVIARLTIARTANVAVVAAEAEKRLRERFAAVDPDFPDHGWAFGRDLAPLTIKAWLRDIGGVTKVGDVTLFRSGKPSNKPIALAQGELPNLVFVPSDLSFDQAGDNRR